MTDTRTNATGDVIPLFGRARIDNDPEIRNRRAVLSLRPPAVSSAPPLVDLTGKPKALFLIGLGGTGKTMLARWLGWRMAEQGRAALIAALDPQNRTLADWFTDVAEPETSDMHHTAGWARDVHGGENQLSPGFRRWRCFPFEAGGQAPDLAGRMVAEGVEPVACYLAPEATI